MKTCTGNEKGIALVMVMILALMALSIIATMLFMATQGTRLSGYYKQFRKAEDASYGVTDMIKDYVKNKGDIDLGGLLVTSGFCRCDTNEDGEITFNDNIDTGTGARSCRCDKICNSTTNWTICTADEISLDPTVGFDLVNNDGVTPIVLGTVDAGVDNRYDVFVKIVDTAAGNSDTSGLVTGGTLGGGGVVASNTGLINPPHVPYVYRLEVQAQKTRERGFASNARTERSRLSVLYAF